MGKPCMIEQNNFITTSHDWYKEPCAVFGADALLCAFVSLRIISSEILESMAPYQPRKLPHNETLMRMLNANLTRWEEKWLPISEHGMFSDISWCMYADLYVEGVDRCQGFLICFYGSHLRLLLNSFSLQEYLNVSRAGIPKSKQAVWICYNSAIDMLKQISDKFGPLKLLYFAQDSVHMMTAYAAVFLIKVCCHVYINLEELQLIFIDASVSTRACQERVRNIINRDYSRNSTYICQPVCNTEECMRPSSKIFK